MPGFGGRFLAALATADTATTWPGVPAGWLAAALTLTAAVTAAAVTGVVLLVRRLRPRRQRGGWALADPSLADARDLATLTPTGATARARALRPSLAPLSRLAAADRGWPIGDLTPGGTPLYGSDEDVAVAVMAPRAGKTTALAVPVILDAPGAVVATANKADLWATTAALRAERGRVWVFDPSGSPTPHPPGGGTP
ncbi:hypothetical protein FDG2_0599 [Candidatus Protofrankia californiensis]|uniref:Uncharacterized protein n=1 Tax=Candidatus Protofrankia californiensis TaxID=1839754 RepID=A0A1C3NTW3_9ACTN|nr:hypothetical protein FDG2_0599 [Candidatus Protofrankia californiensis]